MDEYWRHNLAEDGACQANLEAACLGSHPTTGHYDCPMTDYHLSGVIELDNMQIYHHLFAVMSLLTSVELSTDLCSSADSIIRPL